MKILHVTTSLSSKWGGPTRSAQGLIESLTKKGIKVSIFSPLKKGDEENIVKPKGAQVTLFKEDGFSSFWNGYSSKLRKNIFKEINNFDLIHIHEIWHYPCFVSYLSARRNKKPYIITPRGTLDPWSLNYKSLKKKVFSFLIQRRILNQASALHALTKKEKEDIKSFGASNYTKVIPNGINIGDFNNLPSRRDLNNIYPQLKNKKVVLFFGRIHPKKGLDILAKSFGEIAKNRNDLFLLVAGPDEIGYKRKIEEILKEEGVSEKVIFTGALKGKERLTVLGGSDLFVLSSYSEGFSMAILEAMACKLPVIITTQCNFPEVSKKKAGFVIHPEKNELVAAMDKLLNDNQSRKRAGENGRNLILEKFIWEKVAEEMISLYEEILNKEKNKK